MDDDAPTFLRDALRGAVLFGAVLLALVLGLVGRILLFEVAPWLHGALP